MAIFTVGDNDNLECPHCSRCIHGVCRGADIPFERKVILLKVICPHCGEKLYCQVSWEIKVVAEKNPLT